MVWGSGMGGGWGGQVQLFVTKCDSRAEEEVLLKECDATHNKH